MAGRAESFPEGRALQNVCRRAGFVKFATTPPITLSVSSCRPDGRTSRRKGNWNASAIPYRRHAIIYCSAANPRHVAVYRRIFSSESVAFCCEGWPGNTHFFHASSYVCRLSPPLDISDKACKKALDESGIANQYSSSTRCLSNIKLVRANPHFWTKSNSPAWAK